MQHIICPVNTLFDRIVIRHIAPDDLQSRAAILLEKFFILCGRTGQNPGDKAVAPREQLFHSLLSHGSGRAGHENDLFRTKRVSVFLGIVKLQGRIEAFSCRVESPAGACRVTDFKICNPVLIAGGCQSAAVSLF